MKIRYNKSVHMGGKARCASLAGYGPTYPERIENER